ncbi:hypothetical protein Z042_20890 [Chania multitudinisentens RB-25]|uniref:Uncharacterized protein n=1 Tax=Chania multitudinisentens RB-25 TaxID=1441930 RepID=W0LLN8_9GAMM|nr:hypothetical protein Z042_20890 [Chania multitudinisentens RB-25]
MLFPSRRSRTGCIMVACFIAPKNKGRSSAPLFTLQRILQLFNDLLQEELLTIKHQYFDFCSLFNVLN